MAIASPPVGRFHGALHLLGGAVDRHRRRRDRHLDLLPVVVSRNAEVAVDPRVRPAVARSTASGRWLARVRDGDGTLAPLHNTVPYSRANVQRNLSLDWNWTPQAIFGTAHPGSKSAPPAAVCMVQNF